MNTTVVTISYPKPALAASYAKISYPEKFDPIAPANDLRPAARHSRLEKRLSPYRVTIKYNRNNDQPKFVEKPQVLDASELSFTSDEHEPAIRKWLRAQGLL